MNGQFKNYASNFSYTASGVIKHLQLGNGLWESAKMNSRNQVTELNMGNSPTDGSLWKLNYDYGEFDQNGNVDATKNAGNIAKQTISFSGLATPFVQTYKYDSLDRITEAKETNNGNQTWMQTFGYDRYGNRRFDEANTDTLDASCPQAVCNPQVDASTNKLVGYTFDNAGNTTVDAEGRQFTYNAENKQTLVKDSQGQTIGEYFYDGGGKRIKKVVGNETTVLVYDALGKLIAEYANQTSASPQVNYLTQDHLGSPRITTDKDGKVYSRRDFMPYGEEITSADTPQRNINLNYGEDGIRQKFTSYERDDETDLDFAQARMYAKNLGRFTGVDMGPFTPADPQNFNRYAYVQNTPMKFIDPTGNEIELSGAGAKDFIDYLEKRSGRKLKYTVKSGIYTITGSKKDKSFTGKVNEKFAKVVKEVAGASETAKWNVDRDIANVLVDDTVEAKKNKTLANIDMDDIDVIDKAASELGDALTAHVLIEGLRFAQGSPSDVGDPSRYGYEDIDSGAHINALAVEADVMSGATGKNEGKIAEHRDTDLHTQGVWNIIFTTVQYDVTIKGSATNPNSVIVDKVTKTTPIRKPQFPPGP